MERKAGGNLDTVTLLSDVTFLVDLCPVPCCFPSARVNWCGSASVVIFSNSVMINSLSSFSVLFQSSVCCAVRVA